MNKRRKMHVCRRLTVLLSALLLCAVVLLPAAAALPAGTSGGNDAAAGGGSPAATGECDLTLRGYQNQAETDGVGLVSVRVVGEITNLAEYDEIGFIVHTDKVTRRVPVTAVYRKLLAAGAGDDRTFTEILPLCEGNYLCALTLRNIRVSAYAGMTVTPYTVSTDGTETTGESHMLRKAAGSPSFAATYDLTFRDTDGSLLSLVTAESGAAATPPEAPTRIGYRFAGWCHPDGTAWDAAAAVTEDLTLTACWESLTPAPAATVTGIYLDPGTIEMWTDMSLKLAPAPEAVSGPLGSLSVLAEAGITLSFHTLDPAVATVAGDGTITSVGIGTTLVYATVGTGGTIDNGSGDVTVVPGDVTNAVTVHVVDKPAYLKTYEQDPEHQKITLSNASDKDYSRFSSYPTGAYGAANIAAWYGDAGAVFTLTADDNLLYDFETWCSFYTDYGVVTTLFVPTRLRSDSADAWRQMTDRGLAVQSHSHFHRASSSYKSGKLSSAQDWMDYYRAKKEIELVGLDSLTIAYPCGYNNKAFSPLLYIAGRGTAGISNGYSPDYNMVNAYSGISEKADSDLLAAINGRTGGWVAVLYHSIRGEASGLLSRLSAYKPYIDSGALWAPGFAAAAQYGQERDTATLTMGAIGADRMTFTLTDRMNDLLFDQALTVRIKADGTWQAARAYQGGCETPVRVVNDGGETYLLVDAVPDRGEVTVVRTEFSGLTAGADRIAFTPTEAGDGFGMTEMTRRFSVGDAWTCVYATQGGRRLPATTAVVGGSRYVEVTFEVGGGEVVLTPASGQQSGAAVCTMTDVYGGAVTPVAGVPVTVSCAAELRMFAAYVNAGNDCAGLTVRLTDDIDLSGVRFTPIGRYCYAATTSYTFSTPFRGTFDGDGHTIRALNVQEHTWSAGLFGATDGATVMNVCVVASDVRGIRSTGGIIGRMKNGLMENCSYEGTVVSVAEGGVSLTGCYTGGLVGEVNGGTVRHAGVEARVTIYGGTARNTYNFGSVPGNYTPASFAGGAVGYSGSTDTVISNVRVSGSVTGVALGGVACARIGGFIGGGNYARITDCDAHTAVSGGQYVGGFVGEISDNSYKSANIRNCAAYGEAHGGDLVGGFAGYIGTNKSVSLKNSYSAVTVSASDDAARVGAVVGLAVAGQNSPVVSGLYYESGCNPGLPASVHSGAVSVGAEAVTSAASALDAMNLLAAAAGDGTWSLSDGRISPVHYPIHRVTFVGRNGDVVAVYNVGDGMGVTAPAAPGYLGYRFTSWDADTSLVVSDMTVSAQYEAVAVHTVTFLDRDGGEIARVSVNDGEGAAAPTPPAVDGYGFTGWSADITGVTCDLTVTAQYERLYIVRFYSRDRVLLSEQRVRSGEGAMAPEAPVIDGYRFTGWSPDFSAITGDLDVYAQYAEKSQKTITAEIRHVSATKQQSQYQSNRENCLGGDITVFDGVDPADLTEANAALWGYVTDSASQYWNAGLGYGIAYRLARYELAPGMTPLTIAVNKSGIKQEQSIVDVNLGNYIQVLAVPLFDKEAERVVVVCVIYYGENAGTGASTMGKTFGVILRGLTDYYAGADAFIASMHCNSSEKKGGNTGLQAQISALDDATPIVAGWDLRCLSETAAPGGASTYYTMTCTRATETSSVDGVAQVPSDSNAKSGGGVTCTVSIATRTEE